MSADVLVCVIVGLMKKLTGRQLAAEIGCSVHDLEATLTAYNDYAKAGNDPWGKKFYNAMPFV